MKWVSIDVGIKNLAYCVFTLENGEIQVVDWNVVSLLEPSSTIPVSTCTSVLPGKNAKTRPHCCRKKAEFVKRIRVVPDEDGTCEFFCKTHAKSHPTYWIPTKEHTLGFLRKQKVDEMSAIYSRFSEQTKSPGFTEYCLRAGRSQSAIFGRDEVSYENRTKISKAEMVDEVFRHYQRRLLEEMPRVPKRNANDADLVSIGWAIKREFDKLEHMVGVSHVIIENQISPIATRMKTIQGMLAQYFIMKSSTPENIENQESVKYSGERSSQEYEETPEAKPSEFQGVAESIGRSKSAIFGRDEVSYENPRTPSAARPEYFTIFRRDENLPVQIHFVSSANKLKITEPRTAEPRTAEPLTKIPKSSYAKNKKDSVQLCSRYLENNPTLSKWSNVLHTTKKDDLADCFLQGIWFLVHQKRITYAENLKINSV